MSLLKFRLDIDDRILLKMYKSISKCPLANERLGHEWELPASKVFFAGRNASPCTTTERKKLEGACTEWCTDTYFPTAVDKLVLVANVVRVYERLKTLTGLKFHIVFKGGMIIRVIILQFLNDQPLHTRLYLTDLLMRHDALSMSDFDFEIVPDNHSDTEYVQRLVLLDFAVLVVVMQHMQMQVEQSPHTCATGLLYLNWDQPHAMDQLRERLQKTVDQITERRSHLYKATVDGVSLTSTGRFRRTNTVLYDDLQGRSCYSNVSDMFDAMGVQGVPSTSGGDRFYATLKTFVGEKVEDQAIRSDALSTMFHLARIKHSFVVHYTTSDGKRRAQLLGGEMIDVSQSHGTTHDAVRRLLHSSVQHRVYQQYTLLRIDVPIHSYTLKAFLFEHLIIVHRQSVPPWCVKKQSKRTMRSVAFLYAYVLSANVRQPYDEKVAALHTLARCTRTMSSFTRPLQTGVRPVDVFHEWVWRSLAQDAENALVYLRALHCMLTDMHQGFTKPVPQSHRLNASHYTVGFAYVK
jgi:hypothetical protein